MNSGNRIGNSLILLLCIGIPVFFIRGDLPPSMNLNRFIYVAGKFAGFGAFVIFGLQYLWTTRFHFLEKWMPYDRRVAVHRSLGFAGFMVLILHPLLILVFYNLTGSPMDLGLLAATQIVPAIVLGPIAGLLCDRTSRKPIMVSSDLVSALVVAAIPLVTVSGIQFGALLGGAVVTETVFSWPGLGRLAVESIQVGDFPVVQAIVIIFSGFTILANLAADVGAAWIDPRIRFE